MNDGALDLSSYLIHISSSLKSYSYPGGCKAAVEAGSGGEHAGDAQGDSAARCGQERSLPGLSSCLLMRMKTMVMH